MARPRLLGDFAANPRPTHTPTWSPTTRRPTSGTSPSTRIPMYGPDPRHFPMGTKTGSRAAFAGRDGLPHGLRGPSVARRRGVRPRRAASGRPRAVAAMVKLNEGVAGAGNAQVDLAGLRRRRAPNGRPREGRGLDDPGGPARRPDARPRQARRRAGIVEERIIGEELRSPACSCGSPRWARSRCCPPTTRFWADPPASPTSGAASRPTPHTRAHLGGGARVGGFSVGSAV